MSVWVPSTVYEGGHCSLISGKGDDPGVVDFSKDLILPYCEEGVCVVVQLRWLEGPGWFSYPFVVILAFLVSVEVPNVVVLMFGRRS